MNVRKLVQYLLIRFPARQDITTNEAKHKHSYSLERLCVSVIEMVSRARSWHFDGHYWLSSLGGLRS